MICGAQRVSESEMGSHELSLGPGKTLKTLRNADENELRLSLRDHLAIPLGPQLNLIPIF